MLKHVAIIPCRAGSKSIKDKNLITLRDKTLVRIAVDQAIAAGFFNRVIVTTDYPPQRLGLQDIKPPSHLHVQIVRRPSELCTDSALMCDVVKHAINEVGNSYHWAWLLQPTSPFRSKDDFKKINSLCESDEYNSIVSFKPVHEHPNRMYTMDDNGNAKRLRYVNYQNKQNLKTVFIRSGNFYVFKRGMFQKTDSFEIKPFYTYMAGSLKIKDKMTIQEKEDISRMWGCNIDSKEDLETAKGHVRRGDLNFDSICL